MKKTVDFVCCELFAECVSLALYNNKKVDATNVMLDILAIHSDFTARICHVEPGMPARAYFKKFREDFADKVDGIVGQIQTLI